MKKLSLFLFLILILSSCHAKEKHASAIPWQAYSQQVLAKAVALHKPVVIDFTADWCPNCHDLESTVFSQPEIQQKLSLFTPVRMDVTNQDDPDVQAIIQHYGIEGVPVIIFLDSHGVEIANSRIMGLVSPQEFLQALATLNILK